MLKMVAPSLLSANFADLETDIRMINNSEADWFHIDVMDGVFTPNILFGFPVIDAINKYAEKPLDVHLMIVEPERYFEKFKESGAFMLTIHYEASVHLHRSVSAIRKLGMKAGVALNPHSGIPLLEDIINDIDLVLIMSVNPGFGGQTFIGNTMNKIKALRDMITTRNSQALIEVDGGIGLHNAKSVFDAGCDVVVAGNAVFSASDPVGAIQKLKHA
jgi:ribulose-phosphate 3-epimerase